MVLLLFSKQFLFLREMKLDKNFWTCNIMYLLEANSAARGYHAFRKTSWKNAQFGQKSKSEMEKNNPLSTTDLHACAIKIKN